MFHIYKKYSLERSLKTMDDISIGIKTHGSYCTVHQSCMA